MVKKYMMIFAPAVKTKWLMTICMNNCQHIRQIRFGITFILGSHLQLPDFITHGSSSQQ